ncbi:MAG: ATP-dependent 6-phosphofructokinase [Clostridia bacterium]|nr:ATP-dependent 6-phosphofructokinase [Clostridia bacterium]MBR5382812.1 ATP-dependent 6-phosphofructokinase [Clostridia bacterium]
MSNIAVLTSGGDSPGMNTAVTAIARNATRLNMNLLGIDRGFNGLLGKNPARDFVRLSIDNILDIADQAGTHLRTARCLEFLNEDIQENAVRLLRQMDVVGVIVIGGDGSFKGARALAAKGMPCIGIPGTIDNDLAYTSMTLGFDTAVNVCVDAVRSIRATSRSHDRPHVVEVMGRHCGDIALMTATATGSEIVICPEAGEWKVQDVAKRLQSHIDRGNYRSTIVIAEGAWAKMRPFDVCKFLRPYGKEVYEGEPMTAYRFASVLKRLCRMPDDSFPEVRHTVIGYTQRGARPSARDAAFATEAGIMAVELLKKGISNRVIGRQKGVVFHEDIEKALHAHRPFNRKLYNTLNSL